jgi:hypothetical protein
MTHFGALAAAASGRSPFVAVYPQSTAADNKPCPWYAAWATARVPHPSAIAGGVTAPDRPSPTGKHHFSGFGVLLVSMLSSGTQDRGFASGLSRRRKNPQHAFLRKGSKAVCPMS